MKLFYILFSLMIACSCNIHKTMKDNKPYILWQPNEGNVELNSNLIAELPQSIMPVIAMYSRCIPDSLKVDEKQLASLLGGFETMQQARDSLLFYFTGGYPVSDHVIATLYFGKSGNSYAFWWGQDFGIFMLNDSGKMIRNIHGISGRADGVSESEFLSDILTTTEPPTYHNKESLDEKWIDIDNPETYFDWNINGEFSFSDNNKEKVYGGGTYIYQSVTGEIFADIIHLTQKQSVNSKIESCSHKKYLNIVEETDSTITVQTVMHGYPYHWEKGMDSLYHLKFDIIIDYLPFESITYKLDKRQGLPNDVKGLVKKLNSWDNKELEIYECPKLYPSYIVSGETAGLVIMVKERIQALGAEVVWDKEQKKYLLKQ